MPKSPYEGGKQRKHFTLSETAFAHLSSIAASAALSRSETLERIIRSTADWEGAALFSDDTWPFSIDFCSLPDGAVRSGDKTDRLADRIGG